MRLFLTLAALTLPLAAAPQSIPCSLDPLLKVPDCWQMTPAEFEKTYSHGKQGLFRWLTGDKTRAKLSRSLYGNVVIDLRAYDGKVPAQEAIVDFVDGKLNLISISFFNRGDNGDINVETLKERFTTIGKQTGEALAIKPSRRTANATAGLLTEGFFWDSRERGMALLEHNEGALTNAKREFLRLRIARPQATGALADSMRSTRGGATKLGQLPRNVTKNDKGDVVIANLPMVDQGDKGYCVAASVQRLFEYYGLGADMHQIAEVAGSDPKRGTNALTMSQELDSIDYRFKTRLMILGIGQPMTEAKLKGNGYIPGKRFDQKDFLKAVHKFIEEGIPLLWALELGRFPEQPQLSPQTAGGHMRVIIGYNDKTNEIIFSDTWGAGHEVKRMNAAHAYSASHAVFVLKPTVR